ncbi:hypothetical protein ACWPKS_08490 [Coraliomargarita sp. W4R72]
MAKIRIDPPTAGSPLYLHVEYQRLAREALCELVSSKHLYQNVSFQDEWEKTQKHSNLCKEGGIFVKNTDDSDAVRQIEANQWRLFADKSKHDIAKLKDDTMRLLMALQQTSIILPKIQTTCSFCRKVDAAHVPTTLDQSEYEGSVFFNTSGKDKKIQIFTFGYQCQHCPEGKASLLCFMVTRVGQKLTLTGRSEFEVVDVPKSIPKVEKRFFSDAIISKNAGKPLAALFYLRTFVEQYLRRITGETGKSDGIRLTEAYHSMLQDDFPIKFRSMKTVYDDLSAKIHAAEDDLETFEKCHDALVKHFNILEMMPIKPSE